MNRTLNLIFLDLKNGVTAVWYRFVIVGALFLLLDMQLYNSVGIAESQSAKLSFGDYYINVFAGKKEYFMDLNQPIILPFAWLAVLLLILYFTLNYPYRDIDGIGRHFLILAGDRWRWWLSKCVWVFSTVTICFLIWFVVTAGWISITHGKFDLSVSSVTPEVLGFELGIVLQPLGDTAKFMTVSFLVLLAFCLLQMLISLWIKPVLAFLTSITVLLLSTYFMSPLLLGNYLMAARSQTFVCFGADWMVGAAISIGTILAVFLLGGRFFEHMDLIARED